MRVRLPTGKPVSLRVDGRGHPPLVGVKRHFDSALASDVGAVARQLELRSDNRPRQRKHVFVVEKIDETPAFVYEHPHALVDAAAFGAEQVAAVPARFVLKIAPLLTGAAVLERQPVALFEGCLFGKPLDQVGSLVFREGVFQQAITVFGEITLRGLEM